MAWQPGGRKHPTSGPHVVAATGTMTGGPHAKKKSIFFQTNSNTFKMHSNLSWRKGELPELQKFQIKYWVVEFEMKYNFHNCNISQNSTDFDLNFIFLFKLELPKNWSLRLIGTTNANPSELKLGQGVLHGDLQTVHYDLVYMHNLTPKIQEVMEFQT
jgi:hypothetical protein